MLCRSLGVRVTQSLVLCVCFVPLFVLLYFFFWPLCCLSFFDLDPFVLFLLAIVLSVLRFTDHFVIVLSVLRFTDSDYPLECAISSFSFEFLKYAKLRFSSLNHMLP